ncbi:MAG TPA: cellulase family glycosylhydrolase, partial [Candidatus Acidoferrales bacterium]|nr:cellulase family glycosylhydrolase [Candidatus Acidoferrales bacterium]
MNCARAGRLLLGLFLCARLAAAELPKIRVAPDGNGFIFDNGRPFVPFGVTYYRPGTGWAPQVWKQFDAVATRRDFQRMKKLGVNCVRVFLSFGSFYREAGTLDTNGLAKFDQFLAIAEKAGIYVHPTGPDLWEGPPQWPVGGIGDERTLAALETFWNLFAARYRGRSVIFAYDLRNEPAVGWDDLAPKWPHIPPASDAPNDRQVLEFQAFREHLADEWT